MTLPAAAILARLARALSVDDLPDRLRGAAAGLDPALVERVEAHIALDGTRTHVYFWTGASALPDASLRTAIAAALKPLSDFEVVRLDPVLDLPGASYGAHAGYHYVVETDVEETNVQELADWYEKEHLPALAAVPGNVRARRLVNADGQPRSFACYDLVSPDVLKTPAWLAVRETQWSNRVRPMFRNPRRTVFWRVATLEL